MIEICRAGNIYRHLDIYENCTYIHFILAKIDNREGNA